MFLRALLGLGTAAVTEAAHEYAGHGDAKKTPSGLPAPLTTTNNPLTQTLSRWKQVETNIQVSTRPSLVRLQQKAKYLSDEPNSPLLPPEDDKSNVVASDVKKAPAAEAKKATATGFWEQLKKLKAEGFAIIVNEIVAQSKKDMAALQTEMTKTQQGLSKVVDAKALKGAAETGIELTYKLVDLTNKLVTLFEAIQEDLTKSGVNLNLVLAMSEDRSERGIYALMQEGVKAADKVLDKMNSELSVYMSALSKRIDQVAPKPVSASAITLSAAPRRVTKETATDAADKVVVLKSPSLSATN